MWYELQKTTLYAKNVPWYYFLSQQEISRGKFSSRSWFSLPDFAHDVEYLLFCIIHMSGVSPRLESQNWQVQMPLSANFLNKFLDTRLHILIF